MGGAPLIEFGASPRASLTLMKIAQALALFDGIDYVAPEQVQEAAVSVVAHRLALDPQTRFSGVTSEAIVREAVRRVRVPT